MRRCCNPVDSNGNNRKPSNGVKSIMQCWAVLDPPLMEVWLQSNNSTPLQ